MNPLLLLGLKAVLAGLAVVAFSILSTASRPKLFSGLFAGAPIVASVSLLITGLSDARAAAAGTGGMICGAAGMIACCAAAGLLLPRLHAVWASLLGWGAWALTAAAALVIVPA